MATKKKGTPNRGRRYKHNISETSKRLIAGMEETKRQKEEIKEAQRVIREMKESGFKDVYLMDYTEKYLNDRQYTKDKETGKRKKLLRTYKQKAYAAHYFLTDEFTRSFIAVYKKRKKDGPGDKEPLYDLPRGDWFALYDAIKEQAYGYESIAEYVDANGGGYTAEDVKRTATELAIHIIDTNKIRAQKAEAQEGETVSSNLNDEDLEDNDLPF